MIFDVSWKELNFAIPAMSVDVFSKDKVTGKKKKKLDEHGQVITEERIIPKQRPRFAFKTKHSYTPENTVQFEKWIRKHFFATYPGSCGVYCKGNPLPVHSIFLGCRWPSEENPCVKYRQGSDFLDCQVCIYRRKNLALSLKVFLKDDRHIDLDNIMKIVLDSLNRVCFYDDGQFMLKEVCLYPYSEQEHLEVKIAVCPEHMSDNTVIGGYIIKNMPMPEATEYVKYLTSLSSVDKGQFIGYLRRCEGRKYIEKLIKEL